MNGWLSQDGTFYNVGAQDHKTGLTRIRLFLDANAPESAAEAENVWVAVREIGHEDVQKILLGGGRVADSLRRQIQRGARHYTHTLRARYTAAQLEFLKKNHCFIETEKI